MNEPLRVPWKKEAAVAEEEEVVVVEVLVAVGEVEQKYYNPSLPCRCLP